MIEPTTIVVLDRPLSWNKFWAGMHWNDRRKAKDRAYLEILQALGTTDLDMYDVPVRMRFTIHQKGPWKDWDNVCVKPYQDALIGLLIEDDDASHVVGGCIELVKSDEDKMVIEIIPVE